MKTLIEQLSDAVFLMDEAGAKEIAREIVKNGLDIAEAFQSGISDGMARAGEMYDREVYFIPELLSCADAMHAALGVLRPALGGEELPSRGRIVIGTVAGDTHDIGKSIVALLLQGGGFRVLDLGKDVPAETFVSAAVGFHADILAISSLMTTTMDNMRDVLTLLSQKGLRDRFKIIVGGKPLSKAFAQRIGADGYSPDAAGALRLCLKLMEEKQS